MPSSKEGFCVKYCLFSLSTHGWISFQINHKRCDLWHKWERNDQVYFSNSRNTNGCFHLLNTWNESCFIKWLVNSTEDKVYLWHKGQGKPTVFESTEGDYGDMTDSDKTGEDIKQGQEDTTT